jgi:beta-1,4-mannosyltransferase
MILAVFALVLLSSWQYALAAAAVVWAWHAYRALRMRPPAALAKRCAVVVGGDMARSPRMQYHACSLRRMGHSHFRTVALVGLDFGNRLCAQLEHEPHLGVIVDRSRLLTPPVVPAFVSQLGWIGTTVFRVAAFLCSFAVTLFGVVSPILVEVGGGGGDVLLERCDVLIVQTPPAVPWVPLVLVAVYVRHAADLLWFHTVLRPVLFSAYTAKRASLLKKIFYPRRAAVVVDWHNLGYTLLETDRRPSFLVAAYRLCEQHLCGWGDFNITVSCAMRKQLTNTIPLLKSSTFGLDPTKIRVLYDCAPDFFRPCSQELFLSQAAAQEPELAAPGAIPPWIADRSGRGLTVVSSTSWTSDDDYTCVIEALKKVDRALCTNTLLQDACLWVVVTGKGATRAVFEKQLQSTVFVSGRVAVTTVYFQSYARYAMMLGAADIGLCVHRSSSGLDLPMKCVDMFGCGLPVVALDYPALSELVTEETGWLFRDDEGLAKILLSSLLEFAALWSAADTSYGDDVAGVPPSPSNNVRLQQQRRRRPRGISERSQKVLAKHSRRWDDAWDTAVRPIVLQLASEGE